MTEQRTTDPQVSLKMRTVRVRQRATNWLMVVEDDWDALTELERQERIYECAMDNDKIAPFEWSEP